MQMVHTWLGCVVRLACAAAPPPPEACACAFFKLSARALADFSALPPPMLPSKNNTKQQEIQAKTEP